MQINYKKNGEFEKLYPKTLAGNVLFNNGQTVEEYKQEIDDTINKKEDTFQELWSGENTMGDGVSIKPSKKLSECQNGWLLVFKNDLNNNNFNYAYIPKVHLLVTAKPSTEGIKIITGSSGGIISHKYVFFRDTSITGHGSNVTGDNARTVLYKIYEY